MGNKLSILIANNSLNSIGGSETFTYTLIEELKALGHFVEYFTFDKGAISNKIEKDLNVFFKSKKKYDLILANHNTCVKELYGFGFIIQTCHGIYPKLEQPSIFADAYVSISQEIQNHLALLGYPSKIILNGINLKRFFPFKDVNASLKKVLSLCHSNNANILLKEVCKELNVELKIAYKYNNPTFEVEKLINDVDLVVGLGRSAYEAMACGRPVVVWDDRKYFESFGDGYVKGKLGFSIINNCSGRYFKRMLHKEDLVKEFLKYDSSDSIYFRSFAEKNLDIKKQLHEYLNFYSSIKLSNTIREKHILRNVGFIGKKNIIRFLDFKNRVCKSYKLKKIKSYLTKKWT